MVTSILSEISQLVQKQISDLLPANNCKLTEAMRYSALSAGKHLRPFILISTADIFNVNRQHSLRVAASIEIIHSYSLIHDDLPAMDNDDMRRGKPSCHKQFNEATAILAGDSLLTLAFELITDPASHPNPTVRCELANILAQNIGYAGMAGGQMEDLIYEREIVPSKDQIIKMHWMKTARLFISACIMGAKMGMATPEEIKNLSKFGENFGLAFQFADDLEDLAENKTLTNNNIVKSIGAEQTKIEISKLVKDSLNELSPFGRKAANLIDLTNHIFSI